MNRHITIHPSRPISTTCVVSSRTCALALHAATALQISSNVGEITPGEENEKVDDDNEFDDGEDTLLAADEDPLLDRCNKSSSRRKKTGQRNKTNSWTVDLFI